MSVHINIYICIFLTIQWASVELIVDCSFRGLLFCKTEMKEEKKTTGFFHHSWVEKLNIIPRDCEIINMRLRKSKKLS